MTSLRIIGLGVGPRGEEEKKIRRKKTGQQEGPLSFRV